MTRLLTSTLLAICLFRIPAACAAIPASHIEQTGAPMEFDPNDGIVILANEPGGAAGMVLDFDLEAIPDKSTPVARLLFGEVERLKVKRSGQPSSPARDVIMAYLPEKDGPSRLVGSLPTKAGGTINTYTVDVTPAVNATLAKPKGQRKLRLEVKLEGSPVFFEIYGVSNGKTKPAPSLEIAPAGGCVNDWERCLEPVISAKEIYREPCLPLAETRGTELELKLLYPAKKITEVILPATGEKYEEGRDWIMRDGKLIIPAGSHVPVQIAEEFFTEEKKDKDGNVKINKTTVRLVPETWYLQRQIAVSYEPAKRDWKWTPPISSLDQLPRLKGLLSKKAPVKVVLLGDSISAGGDCSGLYGVSPCQPNYGVLVARKLAQHYGSDVTFVNPSRAGATSSYGTLQADAQVGWFKPDLAIIAYGMNDRADKRRPEFKANMEKILDTIRAASPETEFLVVTPMLNNPKQSSGLDPVKFIRDETLKIARPGLAFADMTTTELDLLQRKDYLDLSGNGANHPNDFLHRIYAQRILEVLIPPKS